MTQILAGIMLKYVVKPQHKRVSDDDMEYVRKVSVETKILSSGTWTLHRTEMFVNCHTKILHSAVCIAAGPQTSPKRILPTLRSTASSFNLQYPFFPLRSYSSCLLLLPRLRVTILPYIFLSTTCFRRQILRKM